MSDKELNNLDYENTEQPPADARKSEAVCHGVVPKICVYSVGCAKAEPIANRPKRE
jgi:hypothetical protein